MKKDREVIPVRVSSIWCRTLPFCGQSSPLFSVRIHKQEQALQEHSMMVLQVHNMMELVRSMVLGSKSYDFA